MHLTYLCNEHCLDILDTFISLQPHKATNSTSPEQLHKPHITIEPFLATQLPQARSQPHNLGTSHINQA